MTFGLDWQFHQDHTLKGRVSLMFELSTVEEGHIKPRQKISSCELNCIEGQSSGNDK